MGDMTPNASKIYRKIVLILGLCALLIWTVLGTGTSLAWFSDETPEINNIFHFADFEVEVSHLDDNGEWELIDGETDVFDDQALYEPGYVQVVYLKVKNVGDRAFTFSTAVNVNGCNKATNVFGQPLLLQEYLKFGALPDLSESDVKSGVPNRQKAIEIAKNPLHSYDKIGTARLNPEEEAYLAIIVRMPEDVDNVANYRGTDVPTVELGITVKAEQINAN